MDVQPKPVNVNLSFYRFTGFTGDGENAVFRRLLSFNVQKFATLGLFYVIIWLSGASQGVLKCGSYVLNNSILPWVMLFSVLSFK